MFCSNGYCLLLFLFDAAVDFFNEVSLIWGIIGDVGEIDSKDPGTGFPPGFEYRWAISKHKQPLTCSGPEYVEYAMKWIDDEINNENLFPRSAGEKTFKST